MSFGGLCTKCHSEAAGGGRRIWWGVVDRYVYPLQTLRFAQGDRRWAISRARLVWEVPEPRGVKFSEDIVVVGAAPGELSAEARLAAGLEGLLEVADGLVQPASRALQGD